MGISKCAVDVALSFTGGKCKSVDV